MQTLREFHPLKSRAGCVVEFRGKHLVDFTSWDFCGASASEYSKTVLHATVEQSPSSAASPRLVSGTLPEHLSCETRLARFFCTERALLFSSKNQAVLSLVTSLLTDKDVVLFDELIQSPVADAAYLVGADCRVCSFAKERSLETELEKLGSNQRKYIFAEALSPLSSLLADITNLSALAIKCNASLIVDESFAAGAIGTRGAGATEIASKGLAVDVLCEYCDLSLGLGGFGAAVAGPALLINNLVMRSRTLSSESPIPPAIASVVEASIDYVELQPIMRERMAALASRLRLRLREMGKVALDDSLAPVVIIPFDRFSSAEALSSALFERGFLVEAIPLRLPFSNRGVVRIVVTGSHTEKHIGDLSQAIADLLGRIEKTGRASSN